MDGEFVANIGQEPKDTTEILLCWFRYLRFLLPRDSNAALNKLRKIRAKCVIVGIYIPGFERLRPNSMVRKIECKGAIPMTGLKLNLFCDIRIP